MGQNKIANKWLKKAWVFQRYLKQEIGANNEPSRYLFDIYIFFSIKNKRQQTDTLHDTKADSITWDT
jgi:hypothetical protein